MLDIILIIIQILCHIVTQFFLQSFKLCLGIIVVAFKLSEFLQVFEILFCFAVILEVSLQYTCLEFIIVGIGQREFLRWSDSRMFGNIINLIIEHHLITVAGTSQIEGDVWQRIRLYFYIRLHTTSISHFSATCGIEHLGKRVGNMLHITTLIVLIVECLNASTARNEIFSSSKFHLSVIRQIHGSLHQSLSIRART